MNGSVGVEAWGGGGEEVPHRPPEGSRQNEVLKTPVIIHNGGT